MIVEFHRTKDNLTGQRFGVFHGLLIYRVISSHLTHSNAEYALLTVDDLLLLFKLILSIFQVRLAKHYSGDMTRQALLVCPRGGHSIFKVVDHLGSPDCQLNCGLSSSANFLHLAE